MMTGADMGLEVGFGPPVQFVPYADTAECATCLEAYLDGLMREGVAPGDVTILSTKPIGTSAAWRMSRSGEGGSGS